MGLSHSYVNNETCQKNYMLEWVFHFYSSLLAKQHLGILLYWWEPEGYWITSVSMGKIVKISPQYNLGPAYTYFLVFCLLAAAPNVLHLMFSFSSERVFFWSNLPILAPLRSPKTLYDLMTLIFLRLPVLCEWQLSHEIDVFLGVSTTMHFFSHTLCTPETFSRV